MKGKIEKMQINELADGRKYATLIIGGEAYNLWNAQYLAKLKEGDTIGYNFTQKGSYKNIGSILSVEKAAETGLPKKSEPNLSLLTPAYRKDRQIVRMSCIKSAIYTANDLIDVNSFEKDKIVVGVAKIYEDYITDFGETQIK